MTTEARRSMKPKNKKKESNASRSLSFFGRRLIKWVSVGVSTTEDVNNVNGPNNCQIWLILLPSFFFVTDNLTFWPGLNAPKIRSRRSTAQRRARHSQNVTAVSAAKRPFPTQPTATVRLVQSVEFSCVNTLKLVSSEWNQLERQESAAIWPDDRQRRQAAV